MATYHAPDVARLHRVSIRTGLTAWMGRKFCERYYKALAQSPHSFVLVCCDDYDNVVGFACGTTDTSRAHRHILRRRFIPLAISASSKLIRPSIWKKLWTALRRPEHFKQGEWSGEQLPAAELVSIGVDPTAQGKQIGTKLVAALFDRFRELGVTHCHVWTSDDNNAAQAFYEKCGFTRAGVRQHHSGPIHVFVADFGPGADEPPDE